VVGNGWRPQLDALSDEFRLIAFDNRGIGGSSPVDGEVSVEELAADAAALLDALEISRAHVMGHSLGGVIAQQLALDAPDRILSLSLLCTLHRAKDGVRMTPSVVWRGIRTMVGTKRMRRAGFLSNVLPADELRRWDIDELHDELSPLFGRDLATTPPIVFKQVKAMGAHDISGRLSEIEGIPTLVLSGRHDVIAPPSQGRALAEAIAGARYMEFEDAAHGLPIFQAERANACLREHLHAAR
jgi:3-oxoadipate enol-lactonase